MFIILNTFKVVAKFNLLKLDGVCAAIQDYTDYTLRHYIKIERQLDSIEVYKGWNLIGISIMPKNSSTEAHAVPLLK